MTDCPHSFYGHPVPPRKLPPPGGRWHLTACSFRELLLRVQCRHLVASTCLHQGQVAKELLSPWAQRPRTGQPSPQTPSSEWITGPCPTALRRCFLRKALSVRSVLSRKKSCERAGGSWAVLSRTPCSRPRFTLPSRTKQTQPQPCSGAWPRLALCSQFHLLAEARPALFLCRSGRQGSRPVPSPAETRCDRIAAHPPRPGMGSNG